MSATSFAATLKNVEQSQFFQIAVIGIIVLSALAIGAKTYELPDIAQQLLGVLDFCITVFFLFEIVLRFTASDNKKRFFLDGWNIFDTIIVLGSLMPLENAETVLIGRLLRIFRVLRLVSVIPELRSLINALLKAIPRMGYIALLMFVLFYIYGAAGAMFFGHINEALWGDVAHAMLTLFRVTTFEDWTDVMYETMEVYSLSWIYFISFIFLTAFVFLNMMVGTILEVMSEEHNQESTEQAHAERDALAAKLDEVQQQLHEIDRKLSKS